MALPNFRVAQGNPDGSYIRSYTSGAAVVAGNFVTLQTDGFVDPSANDEDKALGVALNAASGAGETVLVATAMPGVVFSGTVKTGTWNANLVGDHLQLDTDGVDLSAAANNIAQIQGLDATDDDSSGTRRVLFSVPPSASQAPGGGAASG